MQRTWMQKESNSLINMELKRLKLQITVFKLPHLPCKQLRNVEEEDWYE